MVKHKSTIVKSIKVLTVLTFLVFVYALILASSYLGETTTVDLNGLFQTLLEKIQETFRSLGAIGEAAANRMQAPINAVRTTMAQVTADIAVAEAQASAQSAINAHRQRQANEAVERAEESLRRAEEERQRAVQRAQAERAQARAQANAAGPMVSPQTAPEATTSEGPGMAPPSIIPSIPSADEQQRGQQQTVSRREGARQGEQQRQAERTAEEMGINGFGPQARRELTQAFRDAMPRRERRREQRFVSTDEAEAWGWVP